jgi:VWFA-related protein
MVLRQGLVGLAASAVLLAQNTLPPPVRLPGAAPQVELKSAAPDQEVIQAPTFRSDTQLIQVDVIVKAKDKPVKGLTKDDFQLYDNGIRQQIQVFSVREQGTSKPAAKLPEGVKTNRPISTGPEPVSATVILLDSQNTPVEAQGYARVQALKYIDQAGRRESIALIQLDSTLKVLQEFTDDPKVLRAAVDKWKAAQSVNLTDLSDMEQTRAIAQTNENQYIRRLDITTAAFEALARNLGGMPGRKKLVWITAALPLTYISEVGGYMDKSPAFDKVAKSLNKANIVLYPVDPRGNSNSLLDENLTTMIRMADKTGGKPFYNSNDVAQGIAEAITDTDVSYTLGFYSSANNRGDFPEHSVDVKMKNNDLTARFRSTYEAEAAPQAYTKKQREGTMNFWVQEPLDPTALPIFVKVTPVANRRGYYDISVAVDVSALTLEQKDGRFKGSVDLAVVPDVEKKPKGLRQTIAINLTPQRYVEVLETGFMVLNQVKGVDDNGKPLAKKFHIVVMDNATMKAGAVRMPIEPVPMEPKQPDQNQRQTKGIDLSNPSRGNVGPGGAGRGGAGGGGGSRGR